MWHIVNVEYTSSLKLLKSKIKFIVINILYLSQTLNSDKFLQEVCLVMIAPLTKSSEFTNNK